MLAGDMYVCVFVCAIKKSWINMWPKNCVSKSIWPKNVNQKCFWTTNMLANKIPPPCLNHFFNKSFIKKNPFCTFFPVARQETQCLQNTDFYTLPYMHQPNQKKYLKLNLVGNPRELQLLSKLPQEGEYRGHFKVLQQHATQEGGQLPGLRDHLLQVLPGQDVQLPDGEGRD